MTETKSNTPIIIPIAGGKGGVGKTFIAANLGIALASLGRRTIVADLDLGGSNLHSFLGLPNQYAGVGDFLKARAAELEDLLAPTEYDNLRFLPGDGKTPFMANIPYAQKRRLLSRLTTLPADYVLLDLGAGTTFNTLDFFRTSPSGVVVATTEYPALMSMMSFLKLFIIRSIERILSKTPPVPDLMRELYKKPMSDDQLNIDRLQELVSDVSPEAGKKISTICAYFRPRVVFNRVDDPDELSVTDQIDEGLKKVLGMEVDYFGCIFEDPEVRRSVKARTAYLPYYRESATAQDLMRIAQRIDKFWDQKIEGSARRIRENALQRGARQN